MEKFTFLRDALRELENADLLRKLRCISSIQGPIVRFEGDGAEKILFCSNNYLNLGGDERVIAAAVEAAKRYGCGAAASRLISGTMRPHVEVEKKFTEFFGTEAALLFPSNSRDRNVQCMNRSVSRFRHKSQSLRGTNENLEVICYLTSHPCEQILSSEHTPRPP